MPRKKALVRDTMVMVGLGDADQCKELIGIVASKTVRTFPKDAY